MRGVLGMGLRPGYVYGNGLGRVPNRLMSMTPVSGRQNLIAISHPGALRSRHDVGLTRAVPQLRDLHISTCQAAVPPRCRRLETDARHPTRWALAALSLAYPSQAHTPEAGPKRPEAASLEGLRRRLLMSSLHHLCILSCDSSYALYNYLFRKRPKGEAW